MLSKLIAGFAATASALMLCQFDELLIYVEPSVIGGLAKTEWTASIHSYNEECWKVRAFLQTELSAGNVDYKAVAVYCYSLEALGEVVDEKLLGSYPKSELAVPKRDYNIKGRLELVGLFSHLRSVLGDPGNEQAQKHCSTLALSSRNMTIYLKVIFGTGAFNKLGRVLEIMPGLIQFHGSLRDRVCETRKDSTAAARAKDDTNSICGNLWTLAHNSSVAPHCAPSPVNIGAEGLLLRSELNLRFHLLQEFSGSLATQGVSIYKCLEGFLWNTVQNMYPHPANTPMVVNSVLAQTKVASFMGRPDQESEVILWALSGHTAQQLFQINPSKYGTSEVAFVIQDTACISCILKRKPEILARQQNSKLGIIMSSSVLEPKAILA
jgi:hypothetical protein